MNRIIKKIFDLLGLNLQRNKKELSQIIDASSVLNIKNLKSTYLLLKNNSLIEGAKSFIRSSNVELKEKSSLVMGENSSIVNCKIKIVGGSKLILGKNTIIENYNISIINNSIISFGDECRINSTKVNRYSSISSRDNSVINTEDKVKIEADLLSSSYGAKLSIGYLSGIGELTDIRCNEDISIGAYCMLSRMLTIYDSDSHSLNYKDRRKRLEECHPSGVHEKVKPNTKKIKIGNDCWIGKGAFISKGANLSDRSIVGMGTNIGGGFLDESQVAVSAKYKVLNNKE
jgi:acetyltransferase-like isoleucine patch superfamily enzyme